MTGPDIAVVEEAVLERLRISLFDGWNVIGYINATVSLRRQSTAFRNRIADAIDNLTARGLVETTGVATEVRLPELTALHMILGEQIVDHWYMECSPLAYRRALRQTRLLLRAFAGEAIDLEPAQALALAIRCVAPNTLAIEALDQARILVGEPDTAGRPSRTRGDLVAYLRTIAAMEEFPGTAEELIDTVHGILATAAAA